MNHPTPLAPVLERWSCDELTEADRSLLRDHLASPGRALEALGDRPPGELTRLLAELYPGARRRLPAPVEGFTGRRREIARAVEHVASASGAGPTVICIHGEPGVGTTELALRLAQLLAFAAPEVQLFTDLCPGGFGLETATLRVAALRTLRPTVQFPPGRDGLSALYRHALEGHQGVLVLDDAAGAEQVRPLLDTPPGWILIVTSSEPLGLAGALELEVQRLEADTVRQLAGSMAPDAASAEARLRAADGHPLALRLALLAPGPIVEGDPPGVPPERIFAQAVSALATEDRALAGMLARLALMPTAFDPPMAASLLGLPVTEAAERLGRLAEWGFVRYDEASGLHRLDRSLGAWLLASEHAPSKKERSTLRRRYAGRLLAAGKGIHRLYLRGGDQAIRARGLFEQLWPHLHAAWCWMDEDGSEEAARFLSELPQTLPHLLLDIYLTPHQQERFLERSVEAARRLGDRRAVARHLGNLGSALHRRKAKSRAIELYEQALEAVRETGDRMAEINLLSNLGELLRDPEELERAASLHRRQLELARQLDRVEWETHSRGSLANALWRMGRAEAAAELYTECLERMRRLGNRHGEGQVLGNLGLCHASLEEYEEALPYYERALAVCREMDDGHGEWNWLDMMGEAHLALGRADEAVHWYGEAVACARRLGRTSSEMLSSFNLGEAELAAGEVESALSRMEEAVAWERSVGHKKLAEDAARLEEVRHLAADPAGSPEAARRSPA